MKLSRKLSRFAVRANEMMRVALDEIADEARKAGLDEDEQLTVLISACLLHGTLNAVKRGHGASDWCDFMNEAWSDARDICKAAEMGATKIQ